MAIVTAQEASSSSSKFRYNYQVFLSFRGEDTRKTFTDHLHAALVQAGIRTFRDDDEIERGRKLESELRKAIQESRISIIVFSKKYASSTWCLDEVSMILEWSKIVGNEVLPIYYDVDPCDMRKQKGSIGEAFARFEKEFIHNNETEHEIRKEWTKKLKGWRVALQQVANLTGMVLKNQADGHEAKFIQEIVNEVERKLNRKTLFVAPHLVGMDFRVEGINSWVNDSSSSKHILVICGMGGMGKTTIAKYIYNLNFQRFEGSSFLASVKEESRCYRGLVKLQMQLLSSISKGKKEKINNVDEGVIKINQAICCKRVLLVIDDVDEVEQLDALLGVREFYLGSKIIVTTRNVSLLKAHEDHKLHTVQKLDDNESLELFSWHAFGKGHPDDGFLKQSERAVNHCAGLPLAHKILGSSLAGKSIQVWESTLEKLESIPENKILNILKTSFDSLQDDHNKNLFLHIACFFVGHDKDVTIPILDACDFYTVRGIEDLVDRCLISIDWKNKLMMHQLLQEMGRQIVDQESPNEPGKRSRLWRPQDSFKVLKDKKGTETISGLILDMQMYKNEALNIRKGRKRPYDEFCDTVLPSDQGITFRRRYFNFFSSERSSHIGFNYDAFSRMDNLRLLKLNYAKLTGCYEKFPNGLRWLCWHGFPLKSIPFDLPLENLVSLDLSYSKLEYIWIGIKVLGSLKILNLSHSQRLIKILNFRGLPNLEKLILKNCVSLVDVCDTIGDLEQLSLLNLENCKSLRKFPNIGMRNKFLQSLVLDGCASNIVSELLEVAGANVAIVNPLPSTFTDRVKMWCTFIQPWVSKPISRTPRQSISIFPPLVSLSLQNCKLSDDDFPSDLSQLSSLQKLDLSYNLFINLPQCIASLVTLEELSLHSCKQLRLVTDLPQSVFDLDVDNCRSLERVTFRPTLRIPHIGMFDCRRLIDVQDKFKLEAMEKVNPEIVDILGLCGVKFVRNLKLMFAGGWNNCLDIEKNIRHGLYEFGIFSTFLYREEIPSWCIDGSTNSDSSSSSSSVSFVVPPHPNNLSVRGLNVYLVYKLLYLYKLNIKINNKTKDLSWVYNPIIVGVPENKEEELVWLSHWKFGSHELEIGDEVDVSAFSVDEYYYFEVKEVGIKVVWGEEEVSDNDDYDDGQNNNTMKRGVVIGGDLSSFQIMTTPRVFLHFHQLRFDSVTRQWRDNVTDEDGDDDDENNNTMNKDVIIGGDLSSFQIMTRPRVFLLSLSRYLQYDIINHDSLIRQLGGNNMTDEDLRHMFWKHADADSCGFEGAQLFL